MGKTCVALEKRGTDRETNTVEIQSIEDFKKFLKNNSGNENMNFEPLDFKIKQGLDQCCDEEENLDFLFKAIFYLREFKRRNYCVFTSDFLDSALNYFSNNKKGEIPTALYIDIFSVSELNEDNINKYSDLITELKLWNIALTENKVSNNFLLKYLRNLSSYELIDLIKNNRNLGESIINRIIQYDTDFSMTLINIIKYQILPNKLFLKLNKAYDLHFGNKTNKTFDMLRPNSISYNQVLEIDKEIAEEFIKHTDKTISLEWNEFLKRHNNISHITKILNWHSSKLKGIFYPL